MPSSNIAALLYHNVGHVTAEECRGLTVTPEAFAHHMGALDAMGFKTIRTEDWINYVKEGREIPSRAMMITFDDAYASLAEYAFGELEKRKFTAVVFVSTSLVGGSLGCRPEPGASELPILSSAQIAEWSRRGIEFGAHAHRHVDLTTLSPEEAERELDESKRELSRITGVAVAALAYPYGASSEAVRASAASRFAACFTIEEGLNDRTTPLHSLKRTMVQHGDNVADICLRAAYGKSPLEKIRTVVTERLREVTGQKRN